MKPASHATYSQTLRNNALWCAVLQEVGWHLQEVMSDGYHLLDTQQEEMLLMCGDMKRKYRQIEENAAAIKRERDHLNHSIANFLATHMPSSVKITTRTQRLESLGVDEDESHGDSAIAGLVSRMKKI